MLISTDAMYIFNGQVKAWVAEKMPLCSCAGQTLFVLSGDTFERCRKLAVEGAAMDKESMEEISEDSEPDHANSGKKYDLYDEMIAHPAHLIRRSYQIFQAGFDEDMSVVNITPVQWIILVTVSSFPGIDMTSLAGFAAVDKTSCGRAVAKLSERGYLQISPILEDLRQKRLSVTPEGKRVIDQTRPGVSRLRERLLGVLTEEEQINLINALQVFVSRNNELSRAPQRRKIDKKARKKSTT